MTRPWLLAPILMTALLACAPKVAEPEAEFSFTKDRKRWRATAVSAQIERLAEAEAENGQSEEWSMQIIVRRDPEGEQLTFFSVAPAVVGSHSVQAFGALLGFAARPTVPTPVTNVCGSGSLDDSAGEMTSGTLNIEAYDEEARTLSGNFRVNVCDVQEPSDAKTLAEGIFHNVPVRTGQD